MKKVCPQILLITYHFLKKLHRVDNINLHFHGAAWWFFHSVPAPEQLEKFLDARHAGVRSATQGHDFPQKNTVRPAAQKN